MKLLFWFLNPICFLVEPAKFWYLVTSSRETFMFVTKNPKTPFFFIFWNVILSKYWLLLSWSAVIFFFQQGKRRTFWHTNKIQPLKISFGAERFALAQWGVKCVTSYSPDCHLLFLEKAESQWEKDTILLDLRRTTPWAKRPAKTCKFELKKQCHTISVELQ